MSIAEAEIRKGVRFGHGVGYFDTLHSHKERGSGFLAWVLRGREGEVVVELGCPGGGALDFDKVGGGGQMHFGREWDIHQVLIKCQHRLKLPIALSISQEVTWVWVLTPNELFIPIYIWAIFVS